MSVFIPLGGRGLNRQGISLELCTEALYCLWVMMVSGMTSKHDTVFPTKSYKPPGNRGGTDHIHYRS